ncbi:MAG: hypothetical protein ACR2H1_09825, partial [Limisphaerales bacterium]
YKFDTVTLKAKQYNQTVCPSCGKSTTVHYSFLDSLKDFHGSLVRDTKYVSNENLVKIIGVSLLVVLVLILFLHLLK